MTVGQVAISRQMAKWRQKSWHCKVWGFLICEISTMQVQLEPKMRHFVAERRILNVHF